MWIELATKFYPEATFERGAPDGTLSSLQERLGIRLPTDLLKLLGETDGISTDEGLGRIVWSTTRILSDNLEMRGGLYAGLYMPFDDLVFFADAGNGGRFGFPVPLGSLEAGPDVFAWDHEDDSRKWVAPSLPKYLEWWATGKILL
jgi:hypothetical protein